VYRLDALADPSNGDGELGLIDGHAVAPPKECWPRGGGWPELSRWRGSPGRAAEREEPRGLARQKRGGRRGGGGIHSWLSDDCICLPSPAFSGALEAKALTHPHQRAGTRLPQRCVLLDLQPPPPAGTRGAILVVSVSYIRRRRPRWRHDSLSPVSDHVRWRWTPGRKSTVPRPAVANTSRSLHPSAAQINLPPSNAWHFRGTSRGSRGRAQPWLRLPPELPPEQFAYIRGIAVPLP